MDKNADKHGTRVVAEAYLNYLYSEEGQNIAGQNYYRPIDKKVAAKYAKTFAPVKLGSPSTTFLVAGRRPKDALRGRHLSTRFTRSSNGFARLTSSTAISNEH